MSESSTSVSALIICATRAASRSLSPKRISAVATVSFSLITGTAPSASSVLERRARVEVAAALLGVVGRQQDLRDGDAVPRQRLLIGMREADLAGGGRGLLLLEPAACGRCRPRWRRPTAIAPEETISTSCAALAAARDVVDQRLEPGAADVAASPRRPAGPSRS